MDDNCFLDFTLNLDTVIDELKTILEKNESIQNSNKQTKTNYNNLLKDYNLMDDFVKSILQDLHLAITNKSPKESSYLKQLYDITDKGYINLKREVQTNGDDKNE